MRRLLLRELGRQAGPALGVFGLGLAALFGLPALASIGIRTYEAPLTAWLLVVLAAPLLAGVVAVAPETEGGVAAFLSRLPVRPGRLFLLRTATAALGAAAAVGAFWLLLAASGRWDGVVRDNTSVRLLALASCAFGGGLLASATARTTLVAFVAAPVVALTPLLLHGAVADLLGASFGHLQGMRQLLPLALVGAAAVAFLRGDLHRASLRPVRLGGLALAAGVLLACGATGAAFALERLGGERWLVHPYPVVGAASGERVVLPWYRESAWGPPAWEEFDGWWSPRWALHDRAHAERPRWLPGGEVPVSFSPDGERLVVRRGDHFLLRAGDGALLRDDLGWRLSGLESGPVAVGGRRRLDVASLGRTAALYEPLPQAAGRIAPVLWRAGEPLLVTPRGLALLTGEALVPYPEGTTAVEACAGTRLVLQAGGGERLLWDVRGDIGAAPQRLEAADEVALSPSGGLLLFLDGEELRAREPGKKGAAAVRLDAARGPYPRWQRPPFVADIALSFAPGEQQVVVSWRSGGLPAVTWLDLGTGAVRAVPVVAPDRRPIHLLAHAWSPGGEAFFSNDGLVEADRLAAGPRGDLLGSWFADGRRAVCQDALLELATGAATPLRPEASQ